ncbi:hypothetical protein EVAR_4028_1 [Eumeta japonica]|uniref:RNA-directed DNA polymerase from mobile element jockey n=1 Tax=Eumeta variegata TaxID=151549 RepID=A0A4C1T6P8_EUMVA|nr:hypothetical protein EVAR_4028_1 [Eumeta japonica]
MAGAVGAKVFESSPITGGLDRASSRLSAPICEACMPILMSYGILVWGNAADIHRIFVLQKRAIRAIYGLGSRVSLKNKKEVRFALFRCRRPMLVSIMGTENANEA